MVRGFGPTRLSRSNRQFAINLNADVAPGHALDEASNDVRRLVADLNMPPGYSVRMQGQTQNLDETTANLIMAIGAGQHLRLHGAGGAVRELRAAAHHHDRAAAVGAVRAVHHLGDRPDAEPVERARHPAAVRHRQEELDPAGGLHQRPARAGRAAASRRSSKPAARGCGRS